MYPLKKAKIANWKANEVSIEVSSKYADFVDIFLPKLATKLSKYMSINNYIIELIDNKQLLYDFIYSLDLVELKILKVFIKNNLVNSFIRPFKSLAEAFIFSN